MPEDSQISTLGEDSLTVNDCSMCVGVPDPGAERMTHREKDFLAVALGCCLLGPIARLLITLL